MPKKVMKNLLEKTRTYLVGQMQYQNGEDWRNKPNYSRDRLPDMKVIYNSRNHNYSTSNLRKKIFDEEMKKSRGKKKIFVSGCFDILHGGHIEFFNQAKSLGDYLIVCFAGDKSLELHKHKKPSLPETHKKKILESLRMVDKVVIGDYLDEIGLDFKQHFLKIKPDILAVTEDDKYGKQKRDEICPINILFRSKETKFIKADH